jgi:DnaJ-class molecular chaperone
MHRAVVWSLAALALLPVEAHAQSKFVGVKACAKCHDTSAHGNAMGTWQASPHAHAFATLEKSTEREPRRCDDLKLWIVTMSHGERYGLPTRATEAKECMPCHSTAFGAAPQLLAASFDRTAGVQCESCHGPGSAHVEAMSVGGNASAATGLTAYADERAIQKRCGTCHDGTCGTLDFATMWPKIKHIVPRSR